MGMRVGIDLGTTYSAVAAIGPEGAPYVVKNSEGSATTPSVVCFLSDGSKAFGEEAKGYQEEGDAGAAAFFKRSMGADDALVEVAGRAYTATDLSSLLLRHLVDEAAAATGQPVDAAVVTVPAYFGARERRATIDAAEQAGLRVIGLLSEPSAAALAYGLAGKDGSKTVLVYDLGGGTFDATIARIDENEVRVLGCDGDHRLGGKDWDDALSHLLVDTLADELDEDSGDLLLSADESAALMVKAEQAKRQLSSRERVRLQLSAGGRTGAVVIERADFEQATESLLRTTETICARLLSECGLGWSDLDGTVLVGGSTRMPAVARFLSEATGTEPLRGVNPDEAVALGAAIHANMPEKPAYALGGGASKAPGGLALKGAKTLVDSVAHAMGMVAESPDRSRYVNSVIIPKNSAIPACESKRYSLRVPARGGLLEVYVLQGDVERVLDNDLYAKYEVRGIQREGDSESTVEVTYAYTADATIEVTATQPALSTDLQVVQLPLDGDLSRFDGVPPKLEESTGGMGDGRPMRIMLAVDVSGSMFGEPIEQAQAAMCGFVDELDGTDSEIACMVFADWNVLMCGYLPVSEGIHEISRAIGSVDVGVNGAGGGNCAEPIGYWLEEVDEIYANGRQSQGFYGRLYPNIESHDCLVLLTDGIWSTQYAAYESAAAAAQKGYDIIAIGFGGADEGFLKRIATCDDYASLTDLSHLTETFSTIGRAMASGDGLRLN